MPCWVIFLVSKFFVAETFLNSSVLYFFMVVAGMSGYKGREFTERRRKIVADLMFKRGIMSPKKLRDVLKSEFGISIGNNTIHMDMKKLSGLRFDDEMREFDSFVFAKMKRNYIALEDLAERARESGDVRVEADVRKKLSSVAKEYHEVCHRIFAADKRSAEVAGKGGVPTSFSFGSVPVVGEEGSKDNGGEDNGGDCDVECDDDVE